MNCKICRESGCVASFHSMDEQIRFAEREKMSDDVDELRIEIQDLRDENLALKISYEKAASDVEALLERLVDRTKAYEEKDARQLDRIRQLESVLKAYDEALSLQMMVPADILPAWNAGNALISQD